MGQLFFVPTFLHLLTDRKVFRNMETFRMNPLSFFGGSHKVSGHVYFLIFTTVPLYCPVYHLGCK